MREMVDLVSKPAPRKGVMYLKITKQHLRRCPECLQLCLKAPEPSDGEYLEEDEECAVCTDCLEDFANAVPAEFFVQLLEETAERARLSELIESSDTEN